MKKVYTVLALSLMTLPLLATPAMMSDTQMGATKGQFLDFQPVIQVNGVVPIFAPVSFISGATVIKQSNANIQNSIFASISVRQ